MSISEIGRRLKNARLNCGLTQADVAKKLGITYQAISNYERGITNADTETLTKLCRIYKIPIGSLLSTPAWDREMLLAYHQATSNEERLKYFELWGIPAELMEEANHIREPDISPLSPLDEAVLYAYHHASDDDRFMMDVIIKKYIPNFSSISTPSENKKANEADLTVEEEADEVAGKVREQYISERGQESPASSANDTAGG